VKEHKIGQRLKKSGQRGFTLVELVFVLAIILVLAGIFLPLALTKLEDADTARTDADLQAIAASLTTFFSDLRRFPACSGPSSGNTEDCNPFNKDSNNLRILVFKDDNSDVDETTDIPDQDTSVTCNKDWNDSENLETEKGKNNAFNHLVLNDPNADGTQDDTTAATGDYKKFKGPYISKLGKDAFGNFYIAHVGKMEKDGCPVGSSAGTACTTPPTDATFGYILSAGPDGVFQTCPEDSVVASDDRGFIFVNQK